MIYVEIKNNTPTSSTPFLVVAKNFGNYITTSYMDYTPTNSKYKYDIESNSIVENPEYLQEQLQKAKESKTQEATDKAYSYEQTDALITVRATNAMTRVSDLYHIEGHFTNMIKISAYAQSMGAEDVLPWNTKENINVLLNKTGCGKLSALMQQMNVNLWTVTFPTYLAQIEACATVEEVNAINIEYANPEEVIDLTEQSA